jgi:hypothetical protein
MNLERRKTMYEPQPQRNELYRTALDLEIDVRFDVYPATSGAVEPKSGGLKLEPDFPAQVHVTGVFLARDIKQKVNLLSLMSEEEVASLEVDISDALEI